MWCSVWQLKYSILIFLKYINIQIKILPSKAGLDCDICQQSFYRRRVIRWVSRKYWLYQLFYDLLKIGVATPSKLRILLNKYFWIFMSVELEFMGFVTKSNKESKSSHSFLSSFTNNWNKKYKLFAFVFSRILKVRDNEILCMLLLIKSRDWKRFWKSCNKLIFISLIQSK